MSSPANVHRLMEIRSSLVVQLELLKAKIDGIDLALSIVKTDEATLEQQRTPRGGVKAALLDLLQEVGDQGLNANTAVELALRKGVHLDRGSVSSILSRLKGDGAVEYDGNRYRLKEPQQSTRDCSTVETRTH